MRLDELLAYLPDNDTGQISAADMRAVVTGIWDETATVTAALHGEVIAVNTRVDDLAPADDTRTLSGIWQVNPQPGVPGGTQVCPASGTFTTAPALRFAKTDKSGTDATAALMAAVSLYGQQQNDASNWARWVASGTATDHGTYVEVPVTLHSTSPALSDAGNWQDGVFAVNWKAEVF